MVFLFFSCKLNWVKEIFEGVLVNVWMDEVGEERMIINLMFELFVCLKWFNYFDEK